MPFTGKGTGESPRTQHSRLVDLCWLLPGNFAWSSALSSMRCLRRSQNQLHFHLGARPAILERLDTAF